MKKILTIIILFFIIQQGFAQIGINTNNPDEGAVLEISSNTKGLLIPRFTSENRRTYAESMDAVIGAMVFDVDEKKFYVYTNKHPLKRWELVGAWNVFNNGELNDEDTIRVSSKIKGINISDGVQSFDIGDNVISTFLGEVNLAGVININGVLNITNDVVVEAPHKFVGYGTIPVGGIIMWSGIPTNLPDGWELCDGGTYLDWQGNTTSIPDLRGRFIVSYGQNSNPDYRETSNTNYAIGNRGGVNRYKFQFYEIANHAPEYHWDYWSMNLEYVNHSDSYSSSAHENRPPFYALAFIIRTK